LSNILYNIQLCYVIFSFILLSTGRGRASFQLPLCLWCEKILETILHHHQNPPTFPLLYHCKAFPPPFFPELALALSVPKLSCPVSLRKSSSFMSYQRYLPRDHSSVALPICHPLCLCLNCPMCAPPKLSPLCLSKLVW
jgi:hypothetical protein